MAATKPYGTYKAEPEGEPTVDVGLTMRECVHILSVLSVGHTWDGYSTGYSVLQKLLAGVNNLQWTGDGWPVLLS